MNRESAAPDPVRALLVRGLGWKAISQVMLQLSRVVVAIILARLLTPADYGIAAMVLVFSGLVYVFADLGLGAALIQRRELTEDDRSTAFWLSVGAGLLLTIIGIAVAGPLASFYGEPEVRPLFQALSLSFLVTALGTTQAALLTRSMSFRSLELRMMIATVIGAAAGIVVALRGGGAWAIITQQLAVAVASTIMLWVVSNWHPQARFTRASVGRIGGYGAHMFGSSLCFYLNRNIDNLLIGRFLGPAALGMYALAYNVMLTPLNRLSRPVQDVFFPALSWMQDDPRRMVAVWLRVTRLVAAVALPAMLGLIILAPEFVRIVLGEQWLPAVPIIQILAWAGLLQSLSALHGRILAALGKTRTLFRFSIFSLSIYLVAFGASVRFGIVAVAAAYAAAVTLVVQPVITTLTARALGISPLPLVRVLSGVIQASAVMAILVLLVRQLLLAQGLSDGAILAASVAVGVSVYVPMLLWRAPEVWGEVKRLRGSRARLVPQTGEPGAGAA